MLDPLSSDSIKWFILRHALEEHQSKEKDNVHRPAAIADITLGLEEVMTHTADFESVCDRVVKLFDWFQDKRERNTYVGPCFPSFNRVEWGRHVCSLLLENI